MNIYAVVVTYKTTYSELQNLINSLYSQVTQIILVNNECNLDILGQDKKIKQFNFRENLGIAKAQNIGIKYAIANGADFILISDQDSLYPKNYIIQLLDVYKHVSALNKVAAVGPVYMDHNKNMKIQPMVSFGKVFLKKSDKNTELFYPSHLISSGMLLNKEILETVGYPREDFFIDWVDTEWCWRAISGGYKIVQSPDVVLRHSIGIEIKPAGLKFATIHNNLRDYYKIRNALYILLYLKYIPFQNKFYLFNNINKNITIAIMKALLDKKYRSNILIGRALLDGCKGRLGKFIP